MEQHAVSWAESDMIVQLGPGSVADILEVVVDRDEGGDVIGVEILGLQYRHPDIVIVEDLDAQPAVHVDTDADAIYVRLVVGHSRDQLVRWAAIAISVDGRIQAIRVQME
jgi:uncharacterized protein YuzE